MCVCLSSNSHGFYHRKRSDRALKSVKERKTISFYVFFFSFIGCRSENSWKSKWIFMQIWLLFYDFLSSQSLERNGFKNVNCHCPPMLFACQFLCGCEFSTHHERELSIINISAMHIFKQKTTRLYILIIIPQFARLQHFQIIRSLFLSGDSSSSLSLFRTHLTYHF